MKIDKDLLAGRFGRRLNSYSDHASVQRMMAHMLVDKMSDQLQKSGTESAGRVLEFGCGAGLLTGLLNSEMACEKLYINDLVEVCRQVLPEELLAGFLPGDIEEIALPEELDWVVGNAVWQWLENPRRMTEKFAGVLKSDGKLLFSSFLPGNFEEILLLTGAGLNYAEVQETTDLLLEYFENVESLDFEHRLEFDSPLQVLRHLQLTGVTGVRHSRWSKEMLNNFVRDYRQRFSTDEGKVYLTYRAVIYLASSKR